MKFFIAFAAIVAVALAAPQQLHQANPDASATIVNQQTDIDPVGNYQAAAQTSNGINTQEQGSLKTIEGNEVPSIAVRGFFEYPGLDGQIIRVDYIADENGFQPTGAHLPHA